MFESSHRKGSGRPGGQRPFRPLQVHGLHAEVRPGAKHWRGLRLTEQEEQKVPPGDLHRT